MLSLGIWLPDSDRARSRSGHHARVARACGIVALLSLALLASPARAQPQKWAVVIGIGAYKDLAIRPLRYAAADARAVYDFLVDPKGGGFPKDHVQLLLDKQATQVALRSALGTTLPRNAVQGDTVFIYYAGHGAPEADLANREPDGYAKYLVPHDANPRDLFATAINMADVETFFSRIKAETVILALDTCYSGAGGGRGFANVPAGRDIILKGDFLDQLAQGKGRAILTAADTNEVALELPELEHGLFTYYLLEALRGKADGQGKGYVTLQDAYRYVYDRVARRSRQAGGNQNPKLMTQAVGEIVLAGRLPGAVAAVPSLPKLNIREEVLPQFGSLAIAAKVPGVEVWLDDRRIGETKAGRVLVVGKLPAGSHRVKGSKAGYQEWEREVKVAADARAEAVIDLEPLPPESPKVIQGQDGAELVLVPAGEFLMGSPQGEGDDNERPQHQVYLDAFYIDKYEVTNARYWKCVEAGGCTPPLRRDWYDDSQRADHPVINVDWEQARAYCRWADKRLPTEAEWEKTARGPSTGSGDGRRYPWGNDFGSGNANIDGKDDGYEDTAPVGSFPSGASPYGALDMAGNVWEWVADWYDGSYYARSPSRNPKGPDSGRSRVLRGGSLHPLQYVARAASRSRHDPGHWYYYLGFRCAQDFR